jgi:hypothetical protein
MQRAVSLMSSHSIGMLPGVRLKFDRLPKGPTATCWAACTWHLGPCSRQTQHAKQKNQWNPDAHLKGYQVALY